MARKKKPLLIFEKVTITDIAAEGKSLVRIKIPAHDGQQESQLVVFVPWCVPGDVVDLQIKKKKHSYAEAEAIRFHRLSDIRTEPRCQHFGVCGGCKWQQLPYEEQLRFKQQQVYDQLTRIGHLALPHPGSTSDDGLTTFHTIMGSVRQYEYRNKLDFGAANKRYLTKEEIAALPYEEGQSLKDRPALGFHITGAFDKILPIEQCHLMDDLHNQIRNTIRDYALSHQIPFFNLREQTGVLRDVVIRNSNSGEWMVIVQFKLQQPGVLPEECRSLLQHVADKFREVSSLLWVDNQKCNDTFGDLDVHLFKGPGHIVEHMEDLRFKVGPKSFYQTNTEQACHLYSVVRDFALSPLAKLTEDHEHARFRSEAVKELLNLSTSQPLNLSTVSAEPAFCDIVTSLPRSLPAEEGVGRGELYTLTKEASSEASPAGGGWRGLPLVYDLYTGTGTIANFVARQARQVIGIEYVPEAVEDAKANSLLNGIGNTRFYAGDMKDILTDDFIQAHGRPDVVIADPPRAGMHPDVVNTILNAAPRRIVYVSCNPATQARDLQALAKAYRFRRIQPVDMFPHTPHVENVVLLEKRETATGRTQPRE